MFGRKKASKDQDKNNSPRRQDSSGSNGNDYRLSGSSQLSKNSAASSKSSRSPASRGLSGGAGAMSVAGNTATFRVQIPPNVKPGDEFQVYAGSKVVRVRAPKDCKPGQSLQISVPVDPNDKEKEKAGANMQDAVPDSENVTKIPNQTLAPGEMPAYMVRIPEGVRPGTQFPVTIGGQQLMVTCPNMARPGNSVRITPPPPTNKDGADGKPFANRRPQRIANPNKQNDKTQMFEVIVPKGVQP
ncbi:hypothetical protein ACHAWX_000197, partial [Stephanocyclus meneghinianus]